MHQQLRAVLLQRIGNGCSKHAWPAPDLAAVAAAYSHHPAEWYEADALQNDIDHHIVAAVRVEVLDRECVGDGVWEAAVPEKLSAGAIDCRHLRSERILRGVAGEVHDKHVPRRVAVQIVSRNGKAERLFRWRLMRFQYSLLQVWHICWEPLHVISGICQEQHLYSQHLVFAAASIHDPGISLASDVHSWIWKDLHNKIFRIVDGYGHILVRQMPACEFEVDIAVLIVVFDIRMDSEGVVDAIISFREFFWRKAPNLIPPCQFFDL